MGEIIARPTPPAPLPFTGERLTSAYGGQTQIEHFHRYLLAREWCRGKDVLDVASGEGYGTALLAQVARTAIGVEIAADAVLHAAEAYAHANLRFIEGDARALPLPDAACDVIVSFETIEHFEEQQSFLAEVRRVLRPGGLLIVSTPDRDNYSPAETPANPYHVRELTGAEFDTLLRANFANVQILLQRPIFGSVLLPTAEGSGAPLCFERRGANHFEASAGLARPQYVVAFASDDPATPPPASVYIETGHLGKHSPAEAESQMIVERDAFVARLAAAETKAAADLAATQGEAKGLVAANEMAEHACAVLRDELRLSRNASDEKDVRIRTLESERDSQIRTLDSRIRTLESELAVANERTRQTEIRLESAEYRLAITLASHSWRVTAPIRRASLALFRRR